MANNRYSHPEHFTHPPKHFLQTAASFVEWRELEPIFKVLFPRTIHDAWNNSEIATVRYCGIQFEIRPFFTRLSAPNEFRVFGPPHINVFPDHSRAQDV